MKASDRAYFENNFLKYLTLDAYRQATTKKSEEARVTYAELSKKISQLIAKSWLPSDPEGAEIREVLLEGDSEKIKKVFKKHGVDIDEFVSPFTINLNVSWDTFFGGLREVVGPDQPLESTVPYPPRPMEVTDQQLTEWVNNSDPETVYPPYPYMPYSCSC